MLLYRCRRITDVGFAALENLPNLMSLDATKCHSLSDDGLAHLAQGNPTLRALTLSECVQVSDQGGSGPLLLNFDLQILPQDTLTNFCTIDAACKPSCRAE